MRAPRLLLLTDRHQLPGPLSLVDHVAECARAGLTHVVVRELDLPRAEREDLTRRLTRLPGLRVLSAHVPMGCADGVHLPAPRAGDGVVSPWPGASGALTGRSCHSRAELRRAAAEGLDYATLSPVAASPSKPGYGPPVPLSWFAEEPGIPVLALGGVDRSLARRCRAAGAHGVAVMGELMRSERPAADTAALIEAVGR